MEKTPDLHLASIGHLEVVGWEGGEREWEGEDPPLRGVLTQGENISNERKHLHCASVCTTPSSVFSKCLPSNSGFSFSWETNNWAKRNASTVHEQKQFYYSLSEHCTNYSSSSLFFNIVSFFVEIL